jgi:hypothetical protein
VVHPPALDQLPAAPLPVRLQLVPGQPVLDGGPVQDPPVLPGGLRRCPRPVRVHERQPGRRPDHDPHRAADLAGVHVLAVQPERAGEPGRAAEVDEQQAGAGHDRAGGVFRGRLRARVPQHGSGRGREDQGAVAVQQQVGLGGPGHRGQLRYARPVGRAGHAGGERQGAHQPPGGQVDDPELPVHEGDQPLAVGLDQVRLVHARLVCGGGGVLRRARRSRRGLPGRRRPRRRQAGRRRRGFGAPAAGGRVGGAVGDRAPDAFRGGPCRPHAAVPLQAVWTDPGTGLPFQAGERLRTGVESDQSERPGGGAARAGARGGGTGVVVPPGAGAAGQDRGRRQEPGRSGEPWPRRTPVLCAAVLGLSPHAPRTRPCPARFR